MANYPEDTQAIKERACAIAHEYHGCEGRLEPRHFVPPYRANSFIGTCLAQARRELSDAAQAPKLS